MSTKGRSQDIEVDETTLENEELATHQEVIPVPYFAGEQRIALRWITPALNMVTVQAKDGYKKK